MKWLAFIFLFLSGCVSSTMSQGDFEAISVGSDMAAIEGQYGSPFDVRPLENGIEERRYIMRFNVNSDTFEQREYIFRVCEGKVIDKQYRQQQFGFQQVIH